LYLQKLAGAFVPYLLDLLAILPTSRWVDDVDISTTGFPCSIIVWDFMILIAFKEHVPPVQSFWEVFVSKLTDVCRLSSEEHLHSAVASVLTIIKGTSQELLSFLSKDAPEKLAGLRPRNGNVMNSSYPCSESTHICTNVVPTIIGMFLGLSTCQVSFLLSVFKFPTKL
jgi:hypothetical protein